MPRKQAIRATTVERRKQILDAALVCFDAHGIESTTIDDIRREAGVSIGSLYHHFGSKEGVAGRLFVGGLEALNADMLAHLRAASGAEDGVRAVVLQYSGWVTEHAALARFLLNSRDINISPEMRSELRELYDQHLGAVFAWFARFVENGDMQRLPMDVYVPLISGPIQDYSRAWLSGQASRSPAEVCGVFADAAWNAVRGDS